MLTVLTVDLAKGLEPVDSIGVMTDARIVYASQANLYLATERWAERPLPATPTKPQQQDVTTAIHRFDISDPDARATAAAARCRATCSTSGRCRSTTASCASSAPTRRRGSARATRRPRRR